MESGQTKLGEASAYIGVSCCICKQALGGGSKFNVAWILVRSDSEVYF